MSTLALPVALPPGTNPDGAYQEQVPKSSVGASGYGWVVPSGEVWLFDAVYGEFFKAALTANFEASFSLLDDTGSSITADVAAVTNLPSANWTSFHVRGGAAPVFTPQGFAGPVGSLASVFAMPGQTCDLTYRPFVGGDTLSGRAWAWVTKFEWGSAAAAGTGPEAIVVGPALYVPGPEPAVAA